MQGLLMFTASSSLVPVAFALTCWVQLEAPSPAAWLWQERLSAAGKDTWKPLKMWKALIFV